MRSHITRIALVTAGLFVSATALNAGNSLSLRVSPRISTAPGYVLVTATVERHPDNRTLEIAANSPDFFRSSEIQLDGASAPMSHFMDWKEVPAGKYDLIVTVIGQSGTRVVRRLNFQVLGISDNEQ